jgi:hypothetical protein
MPRTRFFLGATNSLFLGCGCAIYVKFFFHGLDLRRLFVQIYLFFRVCSLKKNFHRLNLRHWLHRFAISGLGIRDSGLGFGITFWFVCEDGNRGRSSNGLGFGVFFSGYLFGLFVRLVI